MVSLLTDTATPTPYSSGGIFRRVFGPLLGIQSKRRVRGTSKTAHQLSSHTAAHGQSRPVFQAHARYQESTVAGECLGSCVHLLPVLASAETCVLCRKQSHRVVQSINDASNGRCV